ncbi:metallophosphoesterase family protein [Paenibacillus sediminis]|uniref:3',5'-cyclic AMP phosphodiesterase CpdA n=1 Tax=Paenibacillus sediminis TaxID=664909 RepID=A0ABS4H4A8_9BACL|nr:metallophosphoesterase family protein [Paenibacillus sediminis]MBP1937358.1 3',5'-cyclic AMP phosphodiesterase CpdA [Paenibacillus sediminis]
MKWDNQKSPLRFREDGTFTIVQFTDVHWQKGDELDQKSLLLMRNIMHAEKPDLIVYTGDTIYSMGCDDPIAALRQAVSISEELGIPWAVVFGNHDAEAGVTREELMAICTGSKFGLSEPGPKTISGIGNHVITVIGNKDNAPAARLYFLDSGDYAPESIGGYGWIQPDQIAWFRNESMSFSHNNGRLVPALAFFHIPLQEYKQLWEQGSTRGTKEEEVCCAQINSGMYAAMLECRDVIAVFAGHDHLNDYGGDWNGIKLYYGRATGYNTYGFEHRGARIIRMRECSEDVETWIRIDTGECIYYPWRTPSSS